MFLLLLLFLLISLHFPTEICTHFSSVTIDFKFEQNDLNSRSNICLFQNSEPPSNTETFKMSARHQAVSQQCCYGNSISLRR